MQHLTPLLYRRHYRSFAVSSTPFLDTDPDFRRDSASLRFRRYDSVIQDIDNFIKNNKTTHKSLISKAIILKGQAYVQLGDIDQAIETFFTLMIEYSEVKEAPEAHFFVGYCYMLQSKFGEAAEAFNLVVKDYPNSEYTSNARLCLDRIKNMTE